jgi:hypothetical protein
MRSFIARVDNYLRPSEKSQDRLSCLLQKLTGVGCLFGKSIFLASGFENRATPFEESSSTVVVEKDKLRLMVQLNPDAVAFGYVAGEWFPAA